MNLSFWILCVLYACIGFALSFSIFIRVKATLDGASGKPIRGRYLGPILRIGSLVALCFLILKYKKEHLFLGLGICLISAILTLMYFLLVRRTPMR